MVFGRNRKPDEVQPTAAATDSQDRPASQTPKGRPTPSRKSAEASRKAARRIPTDPKAAKKAAKERARAERATARAGMVAGDERYLPARDSGPVRAYVRDYIDGRRRFSEYFVFIAVGILVAGFIRDPAIQTTISYVWFGITAIIAMEMVLTLVRLNRELRERWPDKAERKGAMFYAGMRAMQIRKLRVPAPIKKDKAEAS